MQSNGFIINNGVLKAYIGNPDITELVIPEGVVTIQEGIFQEQVGKSLTIRFPSTFESVSPEAFKKGNVSNLDFSKCIKIKDFTKIVVKGYFSEVILPVSLVKLAVVDKNFRIGKVKIADEKSIYEAGDFSNCKNLREISFNNLYCSAEEFVIPENVKSFEQGGLNCQKIRISARSRLEKLDVRDLNYIGVPASVKEFSSKRVKYVFFEKSALETIECSCDGYVVENVNIENITFKDEMNDRGIKYFETSRGLVITDLDNNIANFSSIPTEYDNKKIIAFSIMNPFEEDIGTYDEKLGAIKTEMKYKVKQNFINTKNLVNSCQGKTYSYLDSVKNVSGGRKWLLSLGFGLIALVICIIIALSRSGGFNATNLGNAIYIGLSVFVFVTLVARGLSSFIIKGDKWSSPKLKEHFIESSVYKQIEEPYRWNAINFIKKEINDITKKAQEEAQKRYAKEKYYDELLHGSKEERQRKELASKLDEINRNLRDSNSSGSYDLYDDNGNRVGRIDKKD